MVGLQQIKLLGRLVRQVIPSQLNPAGTGTKTTVNNVGAALTALDTAVNQPLSFAGDTGTQISRKLGETLNVKGGATGTLAATGNIGVVAQWNKSAGYSSC